MGENPTTPVRETRSGPRATLEATAHLRPALGRWLKDQGVRRLVDAGCGDFNWMRLVDLAGLDLYVGYDLAPELIARNQQLYEHHRGRLFSVGDIVRTPLVACDAVLCRDVLGDLSRADARLAIDNFIASGAQWLLASLPLEGLPPPFAVLPDGESGLAIWRIGALGVD